MSRPRDAIEYHLALPPKKPPHPARSGVEIRTCLICLMLEILTTMADDFGQGEFCYVALTTRSTAAKKEGHDVAVASETNQAVSKPHFNCRLSKHAFVNALEGVESCCWC
ncbi:unnamed protein product [Protopolystoma xenopodis]|uniref:Uncharacterized protein n=1 Tax=Protopolystoma xenopodis TaxID=117903 RepID=A0A448XCP1_9PLAT|nr:unnamed protein product [Protopolystoma xenopodis]